VRASGRWPLVSSPKGNRICNDERRLPDMALTEEVIDVSNRLIDASRAGEIESKDVAAEIDKPEIDLYYASRG
jgi:hypothetical protein